MQVELGNTAPTTVAPDAADPDGVVWEPRVTYVNVPDEYTYVVADSAADLADETLKSLGRASAAGGVTHMPDQEALLSVNAAWGTQSSGKPTWVWSDNPEFQTLLAKFFDCPAGRPDDVEATHHTLAGAPGNAGPDAEAAAAVAVADAPSTNGEAA